MFRPSDPYNKILNFYFDDTQAKPVQLSPHVPSRILHIRAIAFCFLNLKARGNEMTLAKREQRKRKFCSRGFRSENSVL